MRNVEGKILVSHRFDTFIHSPSYSPDCLTLPIVCGIERKIFSQRSNTINLCFTHKMKRQLLLINVWSGFFAIYHENKLKIRPLVSKKSRIRDIFTRSLD